MESTAESIIREKLTTSWKFLYQRGFIEGFGHISARTSAAEEIFMTPHSLGAKVSPEDFLRVDLEGKIISGKGKIPGEFAIHSEIYKQRPDVGSILHYHGFYSTAFTTGPYPLKPVHFFASIFRDGIPVHGDARLINDRNRGAALADTLGSHRVVLHKAHGATVTGRDVEEMVAVAFLFEDNAHRAWISASMGKTEYLSEETMAEIDQEVLKSRGPFRRIWALCESETMR